MKISSSHQKCKRCLTMFGIERPILTMKENVPTITITIFTQRKLKIFALNKQPIDEGYADAVSVPISGTDNFTALIGHLSK